MSSPDEEYDLNKFAKVRVFSPKDAGRKTKEIKTLFDVELGNIRYAELSFQDLQEITKEHSNATDMAAESLFRILKPGNPGLVRSDIDGLPMVVASRLMALLMKPGNREVKPV